jgi:hypothetical protein
MPDETRVATRAHLRTWVFLAVSAGSLIGPRGISGQDSIPPALSSDPATYDSVQVLYPSEVLGAATTVRNYFASVVWSIVLIMPAWGALKGVRLGICWGPENGRSSW